MNTWMEWNVTADVQAFTEGNINYGWLMKGTTETGMDPKVYWSREGTNPALRPYLEVTYHNDPTPPEPPLAAFSATPLNGNAPLLVQFTDLSTGDGITNWSWDFENDGTVDSTEQNPSHTYITPGNYSVTLTVTNAGGSDSEVKAGYVNVSDPPPDPPSANFTATPLNGNAPLLVQFTDLSPGDGITNWSWDFENDDTVDSTEQNPSHSYITPGNYSVNLTVTNAGGSDSEVKAGYVNVTATGTPTISFIPETAAIGVGNTQEYLVVVTTLPDGLAGFNITASFTNETVAEITGFAPAAWATLNGNSGLPSKSVIFNGVDLDKQIEPGAVNVTIGTVTITALSPGNTSFLMTIGKMDADGGGMIKPAIVQGQADVYSEITANFTANRTAGMASAAVPFTVNFTDLSTGAPPPSSWQWEFGDSVTSNQQNPVTSYYGPGNYTVNLTVDNAYSQAMVSKEDYIMVTPYVEAFPGYSDPPTTFGMSADYLIYDINGNGRFDFDDVVAYYQSMQWIRDNTRVGITPYDYNKNGRIDFDDVVLLYDRVLNR